MKITSTKRQRVRMLLLFIMFFFFPITMNYFSPYVIIDGASRGIVNGSLIIFLSMFLSALLFGRLWCGWLCPAAGLQEMCRIINDKPVNGKKIDAVKWVIWLLWISIIVWLVISAGGYHKIDFFLDTENGISVAGSADRPILAAYIIYYAVVGIFLFYPSA